MSRPFSDITLYTPIPFKVCTPEYLEETSLINFVSDLYVQSMNGYKPPQATRVTLQPAYHGIWDRTWKIGSIFSIAPLFEREVYVALEKKVKYQYILEIIQSSMLQLSEEYMWDKEVFKRAYKDILDKEFSFNVEYPYKRSRDKKKRAKLLIEKTERITTVLVVIETEDKSVRQILFSKKNWYWYDSAYQMVKRCKWFDNNRFGIQIETLNFSVWFSLSENKVLFAVNGELKEEYNLEESFTL